jgi:hypothetical protein
MERSFHFSRRWIFNLPLPHLRTRSSQTNLVGRDGFTRGKCLISPHPRPSNLLRDPTACTVAAWYSPHTNESLFDYFDWHCHALLQPLRCRHGDKAHARLRWSHVGNCLDLRDVYCAYRRFNSRQQQSARVTISNRRYRFGVSTFT